MQINPGSQPCSIIALNPTLATDKASGSGYWVQCLGNTSKTVGSHLSSSVHSLSYVLQLAMLQRNLFTGFYSSGLTSDHNRVPGKCIERSSSLSVGGAIQLVRPGKLRRWPLWLLSEAQIRIVFKRIAKQAVSFRRELLDLF